MTIIHPVNFQHSGQKLILDPARAIYWPEQKTLFLTDLHLGKVTHFHQAGIAVPGQVVENDYQRLDHLMERYDVHRWICLGDLFHSHWNQEHPLWAAWCKKYPITQWILVEGNHDRYIRKHYHELEMDIYPDLDLDPFYLIHDWKNANIPSNRYALSGHLHPSVRLYGQGKQQMKLPCFWFQSKGAYLPAFGQFTGSHTVCPQPTDYTFVVTDHEVIQINS
jgi:uncharacterized protein